MTSRLLTDEERRAMEEESRRVWGQQGTTQRSTGTRGDINAAGRASYMTPEDETRRRQREALGASRPVPPAVQGYEAQGFAPEQQIRAGSDNWAYSRAPEAQQTPRQQPAAPQKSFNELQREGKARPAPPQAALQQAVGEAVSFGGGGIITRAEPGQINPWTGEMTPAAAKSQAPTPQPTLTQAAPNFDSQLTGRGGPRTEDPTDKPPSLPVGGFVPPRAPGQQPLPPQRGPSTGVTNDQPYAPPPTTYSPTTNTPVTQNPTQTTNLTPTQTTSTVVNTGPRRRGIAGDNTTVEDVQGLMPVLFGQDGLFGGRSQQPVLTQAMPNFDVGSYLQSQLTGLPAAGTAPAFNRTRGTSNIEGLMGMNTAASGMPTQAFNPGQFDSAGYMNNLSGAVTTAAGDLSPAMYEAGSTSAARPGMYGQTALPNFTQQALSAGGLDVAQELANLYKTGSRGVSDEVSQQISESLANPSAFNNAKVQEIYGQLGQNVDDEFAQRETALREEMAARGLSDSSIQGGRLADLNVGRRSAKTSLANELGQLAARDFAGARSAAIGQGMQRDAANLGATTGMLGQLLGTQQAGANLGLQNFNTQLQRSQLQNAMDRGRFADDLSGSQFQSNIDQQRFDMNRARFGDQLANAQFQQGVRQQNVQNQMGLGNQALNFFNANAGFGQQNFNNQLGLAQANDQLAGSRFGRELQGLDFLTGLDQQDFGNAMARAQFNQQAGDQRYQQGLGYLDRFMGYGQQAFQNDMTQAEFNRALQNDQDRMMMAMLGLGG